MAHDELDRLIEDHLINALSDPNAPTANYSAVRYHGSPNMELFLEFAVNKISAGIPSILVYVNDMSVEAITSGNIMYQVDTTVQLYAVAYALKKNQGISQNRKTSTMIKHIKNVVEDNDFVYDNVDYPFLWSNWSSEFIAKELDIQRVDYQLPNITVYR